MDTSAAIWLVSVWLLVIGGCIGSFMNVVVYRLPRGLSLVSPGSQCPSCQHPIRWYDNIPVVSWFVLRGHCRDCGVSFSLRYAGIEATVAALFLLLGFLEGFSGGGLLIRELPTHLESLNLGSFSSWSLCGYHLICLCFLICAALVQWDAAQQSFSPLIFGWTVAFAGAIVFPLPMAVWGYYQWWITDSSAFGLQNLWFSMLGGIVGVVLASLLWVVRRGSQPWLDRWDIFYTGMAGCFLGPVPIFCLVPLAIAWTMLWKKVLRRWLWIGSLADMVFVWILVVSICR